MALGLVQTGPEIKDVLYITARNNGLIWSLWQKAPGETQGHEFGFWSMRNKGSEANYMTAEKEMLSACEGV